MFDTFAQTNLAPAAISTEAIALVTLFGGAILLGVIGTIGGFIHYRRDRMLMHAERMKALELGRELPDDAETAKVKATAQARSMKRAGPSSERKALAAQCYSTTGWVAGCGLMFAVGAAQTDGPPGVSYAIAASAGAVGVTGMICGTVLATKAAPAGASSFSKPSFDPEAV